MAFTEAKFRSIMTALRSEAMRPQEKRKFPRVGVGGRGTILRHTTRRIIPVNIRDLSIAGIGITCDQPLDAGEHFSLLLTRPESKSAHVLYEVRHCRHAMEGIYDIGARLVETSAAAQAAPESSTPAAVAR